MLYEILDHIRYYKTKQEENEGKTVITISAYDNLEGILVAPTSPIQKGKGAKNVTIRLKQAASPFPSMPYDKAIHQSIVHGVLNLESIHAHIGFNQFDDLKKPLYEMYFRNLQYEYNKALKFLEQKPNGIALLNELARQVLKPLFPSFFNGDKFEVYPIVVPARIQQKDDSKKEDKYFFYQRYIKRMQRYYQADQVIYMECPDFGYGLLVFPLVTEKLTYQNEFLGNKQYEVKPVLYHDPKHFKERHPFFRSNVGLMDMNAYYKHFGFKPIHTDVHLKGGE